MQSISVLISQFMESLSPLSIQFVGLNHVSFSLSHTHTHSDSTQAYTFHTPPMHTDDVAASQTHTHSHNLSFAHTNAYEHTGQHSDRQTNRQIEKQASKQACHWHLPAKAQYSWPRACQTMLDNLHVCLVATSVRVCGCIDQACVRHDKKNINKMLLPVVRVATVNYQLIVKFCVIKPVISYNPQTSRFLSIGITSVIFFFHHISSFIEIETKNEEKNRINLRGAKYHSILGFINLGKFLSLHVSRILLLNCVHTFFVVVDKFVFSTTTCVVHFS